MGKLQRHELGHILSSPLAAPNTFTAFLPLISLPLSGFSLSFHLSQIELLSPFPGQITVLYT